MQLMNNKIKIDTAKVNNEYKFKMFILILKLGTYNCMHLFCAHEIKMTAAILKYK